MNIQELLKKAESAISKNLPSIMTGLGCVGVVTTIVITAKTAPKAKEIYDKKMAENPEMTVFDKVKTVAPYYWPVAASGAVTMGCFIFASCLNGKRNAAAIAAYQLSESALEEFKEASKKTVGEKKTRDIETKVAEEKLKENPVSKNTVIVTGDGDYLCYDAISGRYFLSTIEKCRQAVNRINQLLISENTVCLNQFYDELGLEHIKLGDMLGWNMSTMNDILDVSFDTLLSDDNRPALVLNYNIAPTYDYFDF